LQALLAPSHLLPWPCYLTPSENDGAIGVLADPGSTRSTQDVKGHFRTTDLHTISGASREGTSAMDRCRNARGPAITDGAPLEQAARVSRFRLAAHPDQGGCLIFWDTSLQWRPPA
jgi:hypothetical protein